MTRIAKFTALALTVVSLSACMSESIDADSTEGIITITHTGMGTVYWQ